jgi:hypothetical protein
MDIKVNKQEWLSLSDEDRKRIEEILKEAGSIDSGDKIVGDPGVTSFTESNLTARDGPCQAACTAVYNQASRLCSALPYPPARAVCYAAAMTAYAVCLRNCR